MSTLRRMPAQHRSVALLLAFAFLTKLLVPTGWMPAFDGRGVHLELCGSYGPPPPALAEAMVDAADRLTGGDHQQHDKPGADQPCAFAALSFAVDAPHGTAWLPATASSDGVLPPPANVSIGRGLAAPPPPSTGPPILT